MKLQEIQIDHLRVLIKASMHSLFSLPFILQLRHQERVEKAHNFNHILLVDIRFSTLK